MNYTEMLNKLIAESGMNQKEISQKCTMLGEEVTTTYLSALKNTNGKIASDNVSRVIARACNSKYDEILVVQAYLDRAPQIIIDFLEEVRIVNEQGAEFTKLAFSSLPDNLKGIADEIAKAENIKSLAEFICEYKGRMHAEANEFDSFMNILSGQGVDFGAQIKKKLVDDQKWLLIPLGDMSKSQIVSNEEAEYIKKTLQ